MRRPGRIALASTVVLVALGLPFTGVRFISVSAAVLPQSASARQVDDALRTQFPPNRTSPLEVVIGAPVGSPQVRGLARRLSRLPDVAAVAPPQPAGAHMSLIALAPLSPPLSDTTQELVRTVRGLQTPVYLGVAGQTASFVDLEHSLVAHLPAVLAVVVAATLIVLFLMTGSVILPLKAILMNALSLSAVFGILVLIFQDGNLQGLLGFSSQGALDATQPIFMFAVAFGLATDYGVFLLARIKEARDAGSVGLRRGGHRPGADRPDRDCGRAAVCGGDRRLCDLEARVHQGARIGFGPGRADRRFDHPRAARPLVDGAAGEVELVGAASAAPGTRPVRAQRRRSAVEGTVRVGLTLVHRPKPHRAPRVSTGD